MERGFGLVTHLTDWSCPGLLGYEMIDIDGLLVGQSEITVGLWRQLKGEDVEALVGPLLKEQYSLVASARVCQSDEYDGRTGPVLYTD